MHVDPDTSHPASPIALTTPNGELAGQRDIYGSVLAAHPDIRGGGQLPNGGRSAERQDGLPNDCALHSPRSRTRPEASTHARTADCTGHLHPPTSAARASPSTHRCDEPLKREKRHKTHAAKPPGRTRETSTKTA